MNLKTGVLLSIMMLLEYFIWGAWYVTMSTYMSVHLHATGLQIGAAYSALAIATMISPFFVGLVADRYFAAQKIMGLLHLAGAALLFYATRITDNGPFYWVILLYSLLYMPTIALSNSVAFSQMRDPGKQFPWIRVFGTIGWIVAGILIGSMEIEQTATTCLFYRIGVKKMLLLGMGAWILRYIFFAYGNNGDHLWMLYAGIILHGVCYDFFFVTGYMYTEKKAGIKIKNAAQGLFTFATYGLGMFIGTLFSGFIADRYTVPGGHDWKAIWFVPAIIAAAVLVYFIIFFKEKNELQPA
jgi:MFS family permease